VAALRAAQPPLHRPAADDVAEEITVLVVASDVDGFEASSSFTLRVVTRSG